MKISRSVERILKTIYVILGAGVLTPIILIAIVSVSSDGSMLSRGYSFLPDSYSLDAYRYMIDHRAYIGHSFLLSIILTLCGTVLSLTLISTMAYVMSHRDFRYGKLYTALIVIPMFFSGGLAATYAVNVQLYGLKDTFWALLLPEACSGWYILVMRTYFRQSIPEETVRAARMDGASTLRIFTDIVLPMSKPIMVTVGLLKALNYWNSWYYAMLYISSNRKDLFPLQYVLYSLQKDVEFMANADAISGAVMADPPSESFRMAVTVLLILPVIFISPLFRKISVKVDK